jgi:hypothetical protein
MFKILAALTATTLTGLLMVGAACKPEPDKVMGAYTQSQRPPPAILPYIPPLYYAAIEVLPMDLENTYYTAYGNHAEAEVMYNGKSFIFKNQLVDAYMIRNLGEGYIWADLIKCPVVNLNAARTFILGDRVDIVGTCMGRDLRISPGLYFSDCYVLPANCLQIPYPGGGGVLGPAY